MPGPRLAMRKVRDILRLALGEGLSRRQVGASLGIPHTTVADHLRRATEAGLSWPLPDDLDDAALEAMLIPKGPAPAKVRPQPDYQTIHRELRGPGVTLMLLWLKYRERHPDGYGYSQFCFHHRQFQRHLDVVMRQEHRAGEKCFVDFAGQTIPLYDRAKRAVIDHAELFVAVLGASNYLYAEALPSQELPHWIAAHVHAFEFFGAVPKLVVSDNLRSGVTRAHRYEPEVNATYQELATHYGVAILPTRPYKPRDKAKVEDYQLPARALGYEMVFDYKIDQLGIQDSYAGMLQIEGAWYCPSIPEVLINATIDFRAGAIDEGLYRERLAERWRYQILSKSAADAGGYRRLRCPASNPAPVARCDLRPTSIRRTTQGRLTIPVASGVWDHVPTICNQQSITLPPEAGAKFAQTLFFGSDQWQDVYATLRSSIEGMNGYVKDGAKEAIDDPERRRIRGVAPQSVFVAFQLCAANFRKIEGFLAQAMAEAAGTVRRLPKRRRTRSLGRWLPDRSTLTHAEPDSGPDPPLAN